MKGYVAATAAAAAAKRRWKGLAVAVFVLVVCSLLVPLAFLLGLHNNRFPSGYLTDERSQSESSFESYNHVDTGQDQKTSEVDEEAKVKDLINRLQTVDTEDVANNIIDKPDGDTNRKTLGGSSIVDSISTSQPKDAIVHSISKSNTSRHEGSVTEKMVPPEPVLSVTGSVTEKIVPPEPVLSVSTRSSVQNTDSVEKDTSKGSSSADGIASSCQLEFGSYCLWSLEHKEVMKDSMVKRLKDQLFGARAYYPSIAKLKGKDQLTREMKLNIQEHERMLSEAISDPDLPALVSKKAENMDQTIAKAKSCAVECSNVEKKFRQLVDLTEDEAHFHMKQSAFLYQLGVQTMAKSFHCLSMRLTVEYFRSSPTDNQQSHTDRLADPSARHFVIFSRNILAASVTINSTVTNSYESDKMVFHVVTDRQNFFAMKHWFLRNLYREAVVEVINFDDIKPNQYPQLMPSEEFRVSIRSNVQKSALQMRTEYISVFSQSHFFLPEMFKNLKKVMVLDDDVVVQRDLSFLWNLDLQGKANGAARFCNVKLDQLKAYLGNSSYDGNSCVWMSGLNIVDLEIWREHGISVTYQRFLNEFKDENESSLRAATLPGSLIAFNEKVYALDDNLIQSRLGYDYGVSPENIKNAVILHYNGNMKPWLDLAIPKYKRYWKQYLTREERFMDDCNVNL